MRRKRIVIAQCFLKRARAKFKVKPEDPVEALWFDLLRSRVKRARACEGLDEVELQTAMDAAADGRLDVVRDRLLRGALRMASGLKQPLEVKDSRPGRAWRNTEWIFGSSRDLYDPLEDD